MAEYKYTIEVTLRSEVPKVDKPQTPQANPLFNVAQVMPILLEALKNVKVETKEVDKK
jgi:hypothetical protein